MDVAVSGSSGLIGTALVAGLAEAGHRPIRLVRRQPAAGADEIRWLPAEGEIDAESLDGIDAIVNLSGAGIGDRRWTPAYKQLCVTSRTVSTSLLATTAAAMARPPKVLLSGSAIGFYGSQGDTELTEQSPPGSDFLADLVVAWEGAAEPAIDAGIRTAFLRTGIVLSTDGGALAKLLPLFKIGLGGRFGSGRQYMSWITIDDEVDAILHLLDGTAAGPVNLTAPSPVTNAEFTETLSDVLGRPSLLPIPAFGPKLVMGSERADALLFDSMRVLPDVLQGSGFNFASKILEDGLRAVLDRDSV
ncbi:MAG: TIGR01777 family oxidoreductase [Acidimicrobiales bacterium]